MRALCFIAAISLLAGCTNNAELPVTAGIGPDPRLPPPEDPLVPTVHNGAPAGSAIDVLTGFEEDGTAYGRPVGVAIDDQGALLVADDVGNVVWRVTGNE